MKSRIIEVTRYYAYDGKEFDVIDDCRDYELMKKVKLDGEIREIRERIRCLKESANESRLQFLLGQCDANNALKNGCIISFHRKMAEYYELKNAYNVNMLDLSTERKRLKERIDKYYLWFGGRENKSAIAKAERRKKSLRWRQENTPDKWRTPKGGDK